jgi:biopolymer transport protein ExbD
MAEINTGGGDKHKGGKVRSKKASTRVDLTPMVDLGFLLITFFMLATTLIKPQTMEINLPRNDKIDKKDETKVKMSLAITIILAKNNKVFYYFGDTDPKTKLEPTVVPSDFSKTGIRKMLLDRNTAIVAKIKELRKIKIKTQMSDVEFRKEASVIRSDKDAPVVMITATDEAKYNNLVNILDEMQICNISKYAIIDLSTHHKDLIKPLDK